MIVYLLHVGMVGQRQKQNEEPSVRKECEQKTERCIHKSFQLWPRNLPNALINDSISEAVQCDKNEHKRGQEDESELLAE